MSSSIGFYLLCSAPLVVGSCSDVADTAPASPVHRQDPLVLERYLERREAVRARLEVVCRNESALPEGLCVGGVRWDDVCLRGRVNPDGCLIRGVPPRPESDRDDNGSSAKGMKEEGKVKTGEENKATE